PTTVLQYKEWRSIGCQGDSTAARALHHLVTGSSANRTVESCLDACAAAGFILGGLEFGHECYCGNALLYVYNVPQGNCVLPCAGDASELCGESQALNLYQFANTSFTTGPPSLRIKIGTGGRASRPSLFPFGPLVPIPAEQMTVERCIDGCAAAGYNAAGLQDGQVGRPSFISTADNERIPYRDAVPDCQSPCLGNATEICGGVIERSPIVESKISGYLTCEFLGRNC
ncbi:hypothetical protein DFH08DRAFT_711878, partial [Mycena albidolilacea]